MSMPLSLERGSELPGPLDADVFQDSAVNVVSLPYDFIDNVFFPPAYLIIRI